ncbi:hypothetical protein CBR_g55636 [Chara braunii]|uniref:RNA-directed DNA polymerase n=1 Tax=Chara braunii TaxID=69332 RepID=A0A388MD41_CHABU|nr:hypothetical protein CBR_g55636 [Chara braunii]|eukprot:GBG92484.1 hypothetical protein CBR_g55636 [Chara braunii]
MDQRSGEADEAYQARMLAWSTETKKRADNAAAIAKKKAEDAEQARLLALEQQHQHDEAAARAIDEERNQRREKIFSGEQTLLTMAAEWRTEAENGKLEDCGNKIALLLLHLTELLATCITQQEDIHSLDDSLAQVQACLQQLKQRPVAAPDASSSNTSDRLEALEMDVGSLKDGVQLQQTATQQLEQRIRTAANTSSSEPRETAPKFDGHEIFYDSMKTDPIPWFRKFELTLQLHNVKEHKHHAYLYSRSGGACQAWLNNLLSKYGVVAADLHTTISWDDLKATWHKRFQVEPPEIKAMDKLMVFEQGTLPSTDSIAEYQRLTLGTSCNALLDSGTSRNFTSQSFMQRDGLGAQVQRKANPTAIQLADGKTQQLLDRYIEVVPVYFAPYACEPVTFDILDTDFDIILGMPWLANADHTVNFHRRTLSVRDTFGAEVACTIRLPHPSIWCQVVTAKSFRATCAYEQLEEIGLCFLRTAAVADASPMDLSSDPQVVRLLEEFADIFESPTGVVPDRPISHEIILEVGVVSPKGCIYRMSKEELEVLPTQLDDLLAKGWIRPSSSPYGEPVLFVRKKNKDLRLCIDYDDILVYSRTLEDHLGHLRRVLETLCRAKYKANRDKCDFVRQELEYLGHFVTPEGISPLSDKIQPRNVTDVRSFLGLANYYQRFIKSYSKIAAHLTKLQCEDRPFDFGEEARVSTDASGYGIAAVLKQHDGMDWHLVEYFSKKVSVVHSIDDARKKELPAFVHALKRWRHFLLGRSQFRWVTDNNPLVFYKTQDTVNNTIGRWMAFIDQFDFFPDHIPGKSNRFADALSWHLDHCTAVYSTFGIDDDLRNSFIRGCQADPEFRDKYANCSSPNPAPSHYRIQEGYLLVHTWGRDLLCVPSDPHLRTWLPGEFHDAPATGHFGVNRTIGRLRKRFWWPDLLGDVTRYCESCEVCRRCKSRNHHPYGELRPLPVPLRRREAIAMDITSPFPKHKTGVDGILTVVDRLTKFAMFLPCRYHAKAPELAEVLYAGWIRTKGYPKEIVCDRDTRFMSDFWLALIKRWGSSFKPS